ncbi:hypothetical protein PB2503_06147 [Parvularcula bermudensis HTCC2503]|uniref:Metallo-beta-lactamase domain-containing protein n=1 Tax=Parvularcula bermudensis (strain ATCC BAA-594 / HTCC2503 / KCTC 12087) TaxID=314260 RepID=E0THJ9_PARBH|nr:MBL fold metallo-hydrolase [Parvularcula bermudensis]ADM09295.1 hypothetical protein PB2503_06147 [Parvularcula bermudensis HTCC2503]
MGRGIAAAVVLILAGLSTWAALAFGLAASRTIAHADPAPGIALFELRHRYASAFLLYRRDDPATALLIDAGLPQRADRLAADIRAAGVALEDLDAIILTHAHIDHAGGAKRLHKLTGAPIVLGAGDEDLLMTAKPDDLCPTSPFAHLVRVTVTTKEDWSVAPDRVVASAVDLSEMSDIPGRILTLPGHTKGSIVISVGDALFVGDLVRGRMLGHGPVRHFFMCDLDDNDADMAALLGAFPHGTRVFPSHFDGFRLSALNRFAHPEKTDP